MTLPATTAVQQAMQQCCQARTTPTPLPTIALFNPPYSTLNPAREPALQTYALAYRWQPGPASQAPRWQPTPQLRAKVATEALFLELVLRQVAADSVLVALLPDSLLANRDSAYVRTWLLHEKQVQIRASISLPPTTFQVETNLGVKTSLLVLQPRTTVPADYAIFMAVVRKIGYTARGQRQYRRTPEGEPTFIVDEELSSVLTEYAQFVQSSDL